MCLSKAYMEAVDPKSEIMIDIARIELQNDGYLLIGLLGEEKSIRGKIRSIDFIDSHSVVFEE